MPLEKDCLNLNKKHLYAQHNLPESGEAASGSSG
jgi:hypothetical protein